MVDSKKQAATGSRQEIAGSRQQMVGTRPARWAAGSTDCRVLTTFPGVRKPRSGVRGRVNLSLFCKTRIVVPTYRFYEYKNRREIRQQKTADNSHRTTTTGGRGRGLNECLLW
jgi:hypothetical protein